MNDSNDIKNHPICLDKITENILFQQQIYPSTFSLFQLLKLGELERVLLPMPSLHEKLFKFIEWEKDFDRNKSNNNLKGGTSMFILRAGLAKK